MDAKQIRLEKKLEDLLRQTAEVSSQLQAAEQGAGTPHFDDIELPAHDVGQRLSRLIQVSRAREVACEIATHIACPDCGTESPVGIKHRNVHSMDGPIELTETVVHCRRCRRSFFPSA